MLNLGKMRFLVRIDRPSTAQGPSGQPKDKWILFTMRRAAREAGPGSESMTPQQQVQRAAVLWKLRWLDGVSPEMRLVADGKVYEIISAVDPDGLKVELHISTLERVGEQP